MLTGVGAPLGAVLYGVGAAGSVLSSTATFLEGVFGGDDAQPEVKKPKFDYSKYRRRIMSRDPYRHYGR